MPGRDGTGPLGQGAMTGRQLGACTGARPGFCGAGRGFGRGFGRAVVQNDLMNDRKAFLESQIQAIRRELDTISKSEE